MFNGYAHQYRHLFGRDMYEIYFLLAFRALGFSMIGIFIPLYLLVELHFPLLKVISFFLYLSIFVALGNYLALFFIPRYGAKHVMVASYLFLLTGFALILYLQTQASFYVLAALFEGLGVGLFWIPFHIDMVVHSHKKSVGKASGLISFAGVLGSIAGPIFGGIILKYFGFPILFVFVLCILILSVLPLLFSKDVFVQTSFDLKYLFVRKHLKYFFAYFVQGVRGTVSSIFWPILLFMILGGYLVLGSYATVSALFLGVLSIFAGDIFDQSKKSVIMKIAAPFEALGWILRTLVSTVGSVFTVGLFGGLTATGIDISLLAKSYLVAKRDKEKIAGFIFFREASIRSGEIFTLLLVFLIGSISSAFYIASASSFVYLFV